MILEQIREKKKLSLAAVESLKQAALKLDQQISTMQKKEDVFSSDSSFFTFITACTYFSNNQPTATLFYVNPLGENRDGMR